MQAAHSVTGAEIQMNPVTPRCAGAGKPGLATRLSRLAAVLLWPLLLAACGSGDSAPPAATDTTAPTVLSTAPAASASAVAASTSVSVTFSEAMDASTLTTATFKLDAAGAAVAGSVSASGSTATFTPSAPLAAGTVYSATVSTAAKDVAGNPLAVAGHWTFTTLAAVTTTAWSTPERLDSLEGFASTPAVAATAENVQTGAAQATAVWVQEGADFEMSVYASRRRLGVWEPAVLLENESHPGTGTSAMTPQVVMGAFGRAIVTWTYGGNGSYAIWGNAIDDAAPSANARPLSAGGNASASQLSIDSDGHDVFTVWNQYDSSRSPAAYRVGQQQYLYVPCEFTLPCAWNPADFGWRTSSFVELNSSDADTPQVSAWGSGNAVAVWPQFAAGVWANTHTTAGGWATPVQINPGGGGLSPMVAAAADGSAVAVWIDNVASRRTLMASRLSGAGWSAALAIDDPAGGTADNPQVVVDAGGNTMIAWTQGSVGSGTLYARRCPSGPLASCGAPVQIGGLTGGATAPSLATAPNGDAIVVWTQGDRAGTMRVLANHYAVASAGWLAAPLQLDGDRSTTPRVSIDKRGTATAVWAKDITGKTHIFASRYVVP